MKLHGNARLTPRGRLLLVQRVCDQKMSLQTAAVAAGVSTRTASKWVARYRAEGEPGLYDRSSAPHRVPGRTPDRYGDELLRYADFAGLERVEIVVDPTVAAPPYDSDSGVEPESDDEPSSAPRSRC
jgi:leucine-zipper of insertion element IS481